MDMPDVHHIAIYGDLIAAKAQGRAASSARGPIELGPRMLSIVIDKVNIFPRQSLTIIESSNIFFLFKSQSRNAMSQHPAARYHK